MTKPMLATLAMTAATVFIGIATLILTTKLVGPIPLTLSQTVAEKQSTFDVQGESEISVIPDNAEITLGIDIRSASIASAQDQANQTINSIREGLAALGIEKKDIKTENYSVYPDYDYQNPSRRILGYTVNTSIRVSVKDFEKLNMIIDNATAAGANQVGGIQFTLSPEKEKEVKKQARQEAITMAKENAQELSTLAGMKLGKIVNVAETPQQEFFPYMARGGSLAEVNQGMEADATKIEPGSTQYTYRVTLSYETL